MWVQLGTQIKTVPSIIDSTYNPGANPDFMRAHGWRDCTDDTIPPPPPLYELVTWVFDQDPGDPDKAIVSPTWELISDREAREAAAEAAWQASKSSMLKAIENMYVEFLTVTWTNKLRELLLIAPDYTVTVANTDTVGNMTYLMQVRALDTVELKPTYNYFASEFERFKLNIEALGGIMSKVIVHA